MLVFPPETLLGRAVDVAWECVHAMGHMMRVKEKHDDENRDKDGEWSSSGSVSSAHTCFALRQILHQLHHLEADQGLETVEHLLVRHLRANSSTLGDKIPFHVIYSRPVTLFYICTNFLDIRIFIGITQWGISTTSSL